MTQSPVINVAAAIIERDGLILLARRDAQRDQAGLWEFPGGKLEPGETQPQALARELSEELGITATVGDYIASHHQVINGRVIALHAWHVTDFSGTLQAHCHSEWVWCLPHQARDYALAPADIPLLETFIASRPGR